ncbi:hypothetical protein H0H93_007629 [Arthromyces matolae]|nr:hypothetical protein H0H93_007629 [Arthromyces matolae]
MDLPAPAWRVKISVKSATTTVYSNVHSPRTPQKPPLVTIHSPDSVRSSPRSPRLSGLLHALKDVIGEDPDEAYHPGEEPTYVEPVAKALDPLDYNTVIQISHSLPNVEDSPSESSGSTPRTSSQHVSSDDDDETSRLLAQTHDSPSFIHTTSSSSETSGQPPPPTKNLSPVDTASLHLRSFTPDGEGLNGADSALAENSRRTSRPPTMSPLQSTFGVLASPCATTSSRVLSPLLGAFIPRLPHSHFRTTSVGEDDDVPSDLSLDSPADYSFACYDADPTASEEFVVSESQDNDPEPVVEGEVDAEQGSDALFSAPEVEPDEDVEVENRSESSWDHNGDSRTLFVDVPSVTLEEIHDPLPHATKTPIHYLASPPQFDEDEAVGNLLVEHPAPGNSDLLKQDHFHALSPDTQLQEDPLSSSSDAASSSSASPKPPPDEIAELAYLSSPIILPKEGDAIHSLYDQYYLADENTGQNSTEQSKESPLIEDNGSPIVETPLITPLDDTILATAQIETPSSTTPVGSSFLCEPVFTAPPTVPMTRERSDTVRAVYPPPPEQTATLPSSRERPSPHSVWSPDSIVSEVQEAGPSKKVPFGFQTRNRASILGPHRMSKRNSLVIRPPPLPPQLERTHTPTYAPLISAPANGLRPLRLVIHVVSLSQPQVYHQIAPILATLWYVHAPYMIQIQNPFADHCKQLLQSSRASVIPEHVRNTSTTDDTPSPLSSVHLRRLATFETAYDDSDSPRSRSLSRPSSWQLDNRLADLSNSTDLTQNEYVVAYPVSRASEPSYIIEEGEEDYNDTQDDDHDNVFSRGLPPVPHSAPIIGSRTSPASIIDRPGSTSSHRISRPPMYATAAPKPTLMFAIASDDVKEVRRVLESGDAGPNDPVGPQSALAFALTSDQLTNKMEIVKTLLAFGADPKSIRHPPELRSPDEEDKSGGESESPLLDLKDVLDPATRYYVERADATAGQVSSALIQRSFFQPLTRVRYELIGQDRALEQLFKDLSIHSRQLSKWPRQKLIGPEMCVVFRFQMALKVAHCTLPDCPLSVGSLLDVPTHTVGMTTIHSAQDLWRSYSMSPDDPPSARTLAEFLCDNEGKRCVVVLDEIEKTHGESPLWALLMPWEHGRCTFEANGRLVDVRNVIWLGTSNIGHDLVFEHHHARLNPDELMTKSEYAELMALLRPRVSERLGASMLSRVTSVLPFVPFMPDERQAICYEALYTIAGDIVQTLPTDVVNTMVNGALASYTAAEGARSIYRAVSNQLCGMQLREHVVKRFNRLEYRAPTTSEATPSASIISVAPTPSTSTIAASLPPNSIPAIASVLSLVGVAFILGVAICLLYRRNRRRNRRGSLRALAGKVIIEREYTTDSEKRIDLTDVSIYTEKPEKAKLAPSAYDEPTGWVPQIKAHPPAELPFPTSAASPKAKKTPKVDLTVKTPQSTLNPAMIVQTIPGGNRSPRLVPLPRSPGVSVTSPSTPPVTRRKMSFVPIMEEPMPAPSPRSESFAPHDISPNDPGESPSTEEPGLKLPRLMTVATSFTPSLNDELSISFGETVRMLTEYQDGWCLVQRVGRIDAPKGAVPRFCLQERQPGVIPMVSSRKFSIGSSSLRSSASLSGWR